VSDESTPIAVQSPTYLAAGLRGLFHALATLCGAIMTGLAGTEWSQTDGQTKFLIVVGIVASVSSTGAAFFDKTMARLDQGKSAIATGNTNPPILK
jgi:hypothetical protein